MENKISNSILPRSTAGKIMIIVVVLLAFAYPLVEHITKSEYHTYSSAFKTGIKSSIIGYLPPHIVGQKYYSMERELEEYADKLANEMDADADFSAYRIGNSDNMRFQVSSKQSETAENLCRDLLKSFIKELCDETKIENQTKMDSLYLILDSLSIDFQKSQSDLYKTALNGMPGSNQMNYYESLIAMDEYAIQKPEFRKELYALDIKRNQRNLKMIEYASYLELVQNPCSEIVMIQKATAQKKENTFIQALKKALFYAVTVLLILIAFRLAYTFIIQSNDL